MKQQHMAVLVALALFATPQTSAIEVVYDSYSPVSRARNSRAVVTLDKHGLVRRVEEYLYVTPDPHSIPEPDDRPLELFMTTVVDDVPGGLLLVRTNQEGVIEEETHFSFRDHDTIAFDAWERSWTIELGAENSAYRLQGDDGTVIDYRRGPRRLTIDGMRPEGLTETYAWGGDEYLYTKVRGLADHRLLAFATLLPEDDLLVVEQPQQDDPSPYAWRYEVHNARALLAQQYSRAAAALNQDLLGGDGFDGLHLLPLFAINELGE